MKKKKKIVRAFPLTECTAAPTAVSPTPNQLTRVGHTEGVEYQPLPHTLQRISICVLIYLQYSKTRKYDAYASSDAINFITDTLQKKMHLEKKL